MELIRERRERTFPIGAGILLGLGIGGFFDGILLHQVLQWHHMLTSGGYPATSLENLEFNVLWDGLFHVSTYIFVTIGLALLWRAASQPHAPWSGKMLIGSQLIGFGLFNVVEGIVDHHILGIHHVNETVPPEQWIYWDIGFLVWGALMLVGGWLLLQAGQRETALAMATQPIAPGRAATVMQSTPPAMTQNRTQPRPPNLQRRNRSRRR
jgi:uncharacterized membrane protein